MAKLDWQLDKVFAGTVWAIKVNRATSEDGRTFYSMQIGRTKDGQFMPFVKPSVKVENCEVQVVGPRIDDLRDLWTEACAYVSSAMSDSYVTSKIAKEQAQIDRDKPKGRPGLKELAKADRRARE